MNGLRHEFPIFLGDILGLRSALRQCRRCSGNRARQEGGAGGKEVTPFKGERS